MQRRKKQPTRVLAALSFVFVILAALAIYGPKLIEDISTVGIDSATLADGTELVLFDSKKTKWLKLESRSLLLAGPDVRWGTTRRTAGANVTSWRDQDFYIRTNLQRRRAWVVGRQTQRIVFSVDYGEDRWWSAEEDQPDWATP